MVLQSRATAAIDLPHTGIILLSSGLTPSKSFQRMQLLSSRRSLRSPS